jgi:hypothetical protein
MSLKSKLKDVKLAVVGGVVAAESVLWIVRCI